MTLSTSVIRPSILRLAEHPWFRTLATDTRPGRAVASRFVAGETLGQAMAVAGELDRMRVAAMLDHLGKPVHHREIPTGGTGRAARLLAELLA